MAFLLSRRQLPVSSPTTFRSLLDGFLGATGFASSDSVSHLIKTHWSASQVVLTDSGTSALMLAIKLAAAKSDIVALPAWGCYDLATAAEGADVRVALYDLDPITLAPDYASLGRALERGARAVVIAHFYGVPVDLEEVQKIAEPYGATVVEDAAQAIGASWRGKPAGSLAPLGVLSFGRGKGLNGGGGGALLLNAASHTTSLGVQARHAGWGELVRASAQWLLARPGIYAVPAAFPFLRLGETIYHEPHPPRALARASTRMLRANWSSAHAEAATRRHNAERLNAAARASAAWQPIRVAPQAQPGYLRLPLIPSSTRDAAVMESGAKLGIMPGYPETLLSLAPFRARCINTADSFPGAEALARNLVTVPTHALLTEDDMQQIEDWLQRS